MRAKALLGVIAFNLTLVAITITTMPLTLKTRNLVAAIKAFGEDYRITWTALHLDVDGLFLTKRVRFKAADLCFDEKRGSLKGCIPLIDIESRIKLGFSPRIKSLDKAIIHASTIHMDSSLDAPAGWVREALQETHFGTVDVRFPRNAVELKAQFEAALARQKGNPSPQAQ